MTTTLVLAVAEVHPPTVTVQLYVPAMAAVTDALVGSSKLEEKADGPVHAYVAPPIVLDVKFKVVPAHNGEFDEMVGADGPAFTVIVTA